MEVMLIKAQQLKSGIAIRIKKTTIVIFVGLTR
jgi:hypothetical protein